MKTKIIHWWQEMQSSFWFIPVLIVIGAVGLALGLISLDATTDLKFLKDWPLVFDASADGSRSLLTAVATSMITVAGVIFSITLVALALTSNQYTSRVLRNFMGDRPNQVVLGVFVGIFAYCLVVLRTIRGGDEGAFVPSLSVLFGLILSFIGVLYLIYYIHHISISIQASSIIEAIAHETIKSVDHLFPKNLPQNADEEAEQKSTISFAGKSWSTINAKKTGYIEQIDRDSLLALARKYNVVLRMERGIGDFVVENTALLFVASPIEVPEEAIEKINAAYSIHRQRTMYQDVAFGIRQIVDIALKALSSGINDSTTAVICVDHLGAILVRLATREITPPHRPEDGEPKIIARGLSFEQLLDEAFNQIRQNAKHNIAVLTRLLHTIETIANQTENRRRRLALWRHAKMTAEIAEQGVSLPQDAEEAQASLLRLSHLNPYITYTKAK